MPNASDDSKSSLLKSPKSPEDPWYFTDGAQNPTWITARLIGRLSCSMTGSFPGYYLRHDSFGRVVIDICPSDQEHLQNPSILSYERSMCRFLLEDLVPADLLGKKGTWTITVDFEEEEDKEDAEASF